MSKRPTPAMLEFYERAKGYAVNAIHAGVNYRDFREAMTTAVIDAALDLSKGNKSRAARLLGMHRNTMTRNL
jgi:DNA-binding NtrC family response regulator